METLLPYALLCLTSIFTLANPLGTMPVFLTMTQGMSEEQRQSIVKRATITALIILIVFTFAGQFIFMFFGISTNGLPHSRRRDNLQDRLRHAAGTLHAREAQL